MVGDLELAIEKKYQESRGTDRYMARNLATAMRNEKIHTFDELKKAYPYPIDLLKLKGIGYKTYYILMGILRSEGEGYEPARREATINN